MISSSTTTPTEDVIYDLDKVLEMPVTPPVITFEPSSCFSTSTYVVSDNDGAVPAYITVTGTTISIKSQDESLVASSPHTLKITTQLSNGEQIELHQFKVSFTKIVCTIEPNSVDAVENMLLLQSIELSLIEGQVGSAEASYAHLIEEVVRLLGLDEEMKKICGELETTLLMIGDTKDLSLNTSL